MQQEIFLGMRILHFFGGQEKQKTSTNIEKIESCIWLEFLVGMR